jgi:hypothetical protein
VLKLCGKATATSSPFWRDVAPHSQIRIPKIIMSINTKGLLLVVAFFLATLAWGLLVGDPSQNLLLPAVLAVAIPGGWFAFQHGRESGDFEYRDT